jgi:hypothetical protein
MRGRGVVGLIALIGLGSAGPLAAEADSSAGEPAEEVELRFTGPAECGDQPAFEAAILRRAPAVQFRAGTGRRFSVAVTGSADAGYAGTLSVTEDGHTADRTLTDKVCDDLVAALAFVVALAIDPEAAVAPPPPEPAIEPAPAPAPVRESAAPPIAAVVARAPERETSWRYGAALDGGVTGGLAPDPMATVGVHGRLRLGGFGHVSLGVIGGTASSTTAAGDARFSVLAGRATACWRSPWVARGVGAAACGYVDVGMVRGTGREIVGGQSIERLAIAPGGLIALTWPQESRVFAELNVGLAVPLVRYRYYFNPDVEIHQTGAVLPWASLGIGLRFR